MAKKMEVLSPVNAPSGAMVSPWERRAARISHPPQYFIAEALFQARVAERLGPPCTRRAEAPPQAGQAKATGGLNAPAPALK